MKIVERIVVVLLLLAIFGGAAWLYFSIKYATLEEDVATQSKSKPIVEVETATTSTDQSDWRIHYPVTIPLAIGSTTVLASVADTLPERIEGLSNTPYLPNGVVKLFAFGIEGQHSIWMQDMLYPLDILWVEKSGEIVHIEENVKPESYPNSYSSPTPAWYVIEANAGFVASSSIKIGDEVIVNTER
jgi:uncharacterized protein